MTIWHLMLAEATLLFSVLCLYALYKVVFVV